MTKTIDTLIEDIQGLLASGTSHTVAPERIEELGRRIAKKVADRLQETREKQHLRLSKIGVPCERALWYSINEGEPPIDGPTALKFLYGDIIETLLVFLAEESGHKVEHQQAKVEVAGVPGSIDAVVDGRLVDFKSASPYSFEKFLSGKFIEDDPFGYIPQVTGYLFGAQELVEDKEKASFLVNNKVSGELCLSTVEPDTDFYDQVVMQKEDMVDEKEPPERAFSTQSGRLCTNCRYCSHKGKCWGELREVSYKNGKVYYVSK